MIRSTIKPSSTADNRDFGAVDLDGEAIDLSRDGLDLPALFYMRSTAARSHETASKAARLISGAWA